MALPLGFTNIFEALLKKLGVRFKHIEGYCKYLPKDNNNINNSNIGKKDKNNKNMRIFTMYNNSTTSSVLNNSKHINKNLDMYDSEKENRADYINHCWNSVYYKGEWYLVDTLLGSGSF